jgi:hypothetical protein
VSEADSTTIMSTLSETSQPATAAHVLAVDDDPQIRQLNDD